MSDVSDFQKRLLQMTRAPGGAFDHFIEGAARMIVRGRAAYVAIGGADPDGFVSTVTEGLLTRISDRVTELIEAES